MVKRLMLTPQEASRSRDEIDALADEIALTACRLDAAQQVLLTHIRAFDQAGGWAWQGAKSCAAWLSWRIGCGRNAANEKVRVANALGALPLIDAAFEAGELSYCKVRAMTRVATVDNEALLLEQARSATGAELERMCASVRQVLRPRDARGDDDVRYVRWRHAGLGMTRIEAQLYADEAERVWQALAAVRRDLEAAPGPHRETAVAGGEAACAPDERMGVEAASRADERMGVEIEAACAPDERADEPIGDGDVEHVAPVVIDGYTYGEDATVARTEWRPRGFCGNWSGGSVTPGAHDASAGSTAPGHEERLGRPGLADALVTVAEVALVRGIGSRSRPAAERRQLLVHVTEDRLAELAGLAREGAGVSSGAGVGSGAGVTVVGELHHGVLLAGETLLRVACDAGLVVAKTTAEGEVLDIGRRSRTVSAPLLRALWVRDRCCRFPGCAQVAFVEAHHLEHWTRGGATSLWNTALLCHHHHTCVHEGGFHMERDAHGALRFADPEGRPITRVPAPASLDEPALLAFARAERQRGIAITESTSLIGRDFRRPDLRGAANAVIARTLGADG